MEFNTVKEFANYIVEHLFDAHPELTESNKAELNEVKKNNGMVLQGITIKSDGSNVAPTIYLDDFFKRYTEGLAIEEIIERVINIFEKHRTPQNISVDFFTDFEQVKERLAMKVIYLQKNIELLAGCPHFVFGDLAIIFQVQVDSSEFGNAVITVKNEHMEMWGVKAKKLMEHARKNMEEHEPVRISSMFDVLKEMIGGDMPEEMMPAPAMYVMTNETKINGAASMIFTDKMQEFAELHNCNFYILPSSIHEILLVPDSGDIDVEALINMVSEVNDTQVSPDEILSYNVYYYDCNRNALLFADTREMIEIQEA